MRKIINLFKRYPNQIMNINIFLITIVAGLAIGSAFDPDMAIQTTLLFIGILMVLLLLYRGQLQAGKYKIKHSMYTPSPQLEYYCPACKYHIKVRDTDDTSDLVCPEDNIPLKTYDPVEDRNSHPF